MRFYIISILSSIIYTIVDAIKYIPHKIVLSLLKFFSVIPFIMKCDNIFLSPFLYYALADAIIVYDLILSLPLFSIGHFLWIMHMNKFKLENKKTYFILFIITLLYTYFIMKYKIIVFIFYSSFLIGMILISFNKKIYFITFIIVSDILIVLEWADPLITWPLYYIFLCWTHYEMIKTS